MKIAYKQQGKYKNKERMDSVTEDWNGWQLCFLKTYYPKCFPNLFVCMVCNVWYNAWETYLFDTMQSCDFVIYK